MNAREQDGRVSPLIRPAAASEPLPYVVELWDLTRTGPERVLGRAASIMLANAVFAAAQAEYVGRKLTLKRGDKVLAESA
jgi:hypothetical protein